MDSKTKNILIGGTVVLGVLAIVRYLYVQWDTLYNSCYAVVGGIIHEFGLKQVRITLMIAIENKSDLTLKVTHQSYDIYINDMQVANFSSNKTLRLLSKSTEILPINVEFNPTDLLKKGVKNIASLLGDKSKFIIKTKGVITVSSGIATVKDLPIETEMSLKELMTSDPSTAYVCSKFEKESKKITKRRRRPK